MNVAIIAAAGRGTRMGGARAKQFLELGGIPIIIRTIRAFEHCDVIQEIIVVLPAEDVDGFIELAGNNHLQKVTRVVPGGVSRAQSVWHGLNAVPESTAEIVAVHDGVRPFVTAHEIACTVAAAREHGAAILVGPAIDTIKEVEDGSVVRTLSRIKLRRALTPQCFRYSLLRSAYDQADVLDPNLTDDSTLLEQLGFRVATVDGSSRNVKITRPEDLAFGEALIREQGL